MKKIYSVLGLNQAFSVNKPFLVFALLVVPVAALFAAFPSKVMASDQGRIDSGQDAYGYLDSNNSADIWWFDGVAGQIIQARVDEDRPPGLSPYLTLIGVDGVTQVANPDVDQPSFVHISASLPVTGRYYLIVTRRNGTSGNYTLQWFPVVREQFGAETAAVYCSDRNTNGPCHPKECNEGDLVAQCLEVSIDRGENGTYNVGDRIRACVTRTITYGASLLGSAQQVRLTNIVSGSSGATWDFGSLMGTQCIDSIISPPVGQESQMVELIDSRGGTVQLRAEIRYLSRQ